MVILPAPEALAGFAAAFDSGEAAAWELAPECVDVQHSREFPAAPAGAAEE